MKYLPKEMIDEIIQLEPKEIRIEQENRNTIICELVLKTKEYGLGGSICSTTDSFDYKKGKIRAVGLALAALKNKTSKYLVREEYEEFPKNWTMKQIENVRNYPFNYRSEYGKYEVLVL